jgi:hypothetical protein
MSRDDTADELLNAARGLADRMDTLEQATRDNTVRLHEMKLQLSHHEAIATELRQLCWLTEYAVGGEDAVTVSDVLAILDKVRP